MTRVLNPDAAFRVTSDVPITATGRWLDLIAGAHSRNTNSLVMTDVGIAVKQATARRYKSYPVLCVQWRPYCQDLVYLDQDLHPSSLGTPSDPLGGELLSPRPRHSPMKDSPRLRLTAGP